MKTNAIIGALCAFVLGAAVSPAWSDDRARLPQRPTFTTLSITPLAIEGLTGDGAGNLYTSGRAPVGSPCPVWRIDAAAAPPVIPVQIGSVPNPAPGCNLSGITFDRDGNLYISDANQGGVIWRLTASDRNPTLPFATGVPGTNGLAFDRDGDLWTGDGTTGQGRVWRIAPSGGACEPSFTGGNCEEAFRVQPLANAKNVGRDVRTLPPGTIDAARSATNTLGSQPLVVNGLVFDRHGDLFISDTARGAIWKVELERGGALRSRIGCDAAFPANTLCLDNVFVAHPYLEGADGIALDEAGNIWVDANERDAVVVVGEDRRVTEIFRNPINADTGLRNSNPAAGNNHILEFPTSPFLSGTRFCTSNSDGDRRDNSPRSAGEINAGGPIGARGKISCMDQPLSIPGLRLPVQR
jgi:sugar lactone lactonase YvrE